MVILNKQNDWFHKSQKTGKAISLFFLISLTTLPPLSGAILTLDDAVTYAKANNGTLKVATLELQQSIRSTEVGRYLPSIEAYGGITTTGSIIGQSFSSSYTVGGISWTFDSSFSNTKASKQNKRDIANVTYQSKQNTITGSVTTAYWNVVAAKLAIESKQNSLDSAQRTLDSTSIKYEAGQVSRLALTQAEVTKSDAEYELSIAKQTYNTCVSTLSDLIGLKDNSWTFEDMPSTVRIASLETLQAKATSTTAIRKAQLLIDSSNIAENDVKKKYVSPSVSVSANSRLGGTIYSTKLGSNGSYSDYISDTTSVSVTVSLPLDHYMKASSASVALDTAEYDIEIAKQNYANSLTDLTSSIRNAYVSLEQSQQNIENLEKHLALAKEQLRFIQDSYEAALSSYNDYESAVVAVSNATISLLQQKLNYTIALYDLSSLLETGIDGLKS